MQSRTPSRLVCARDAADSWSSGMAGMESLWDAVITRSADTCRRCKAEYQGRPQEDKEKGYKRAALAVQKENYAVRMYEKVGFKTVDENDEEYIMVCEL